MRGSCTQDRSSPACALQHLEIRGRDQPADELGRSRDAIGRRHADVRNAADAHQCRIGAGRESVDPDPSGVDPRMIAPAGEHVVDKPADMPRSIDQPARGRSAFVLPVVAGMGHGRHDEAGFGQRQGGVGMAGEPAAFAVGDNDERKPVARHRGIAAECLEESRVGLCRDRGVARIPDSDLERRVAEVGDGHGPEADRFGARQRRGAQQEESEQECFHGGPRLFVRDIHRRRRFGDLDRDRVCPESRSRS